MSSEMREVSAFESWARSQGFHPTDFERIDNRPANNLGLTWEYNGNYLQAAWAAWIGRSFLARTEAGADGYDDGSGRVRDWRESDTHPQGRDADADWYVDAGTKSICVDVDFDPARQLSLILKQDGTVAWSIFVQEPDSSTTKATGPSVMNPGFYEALSYIAMQAKEAK